MAGVTRGLANGACMALTALILLTVAPVALLVASAPAFAQSAVISQISVQGNRRVEAETVRSYVTLSVGSPYDAGKADESIQNLFGTGLFGDVRIERKGSVVVISVVENPVINKVVFEGNKEVEDKTLEGEVQVRPRSIFTKAKVQADVQRILDIYQKQGLFAATVEPKVIELEQNRINLVYEISEGPSTKVQSIHFVGNHAFSDTQLKEVVTTSEKSWLSWFKSTDVYDPDRLNLDRELLRQFYLKNGYADAQIVSATADLDRSGKGFYITFTVEEGDAFTFGDITVSSALEGVNGNDLLGKATTYKGQTYNVSKIEKSVEAMTLSLAGAGNAFAVVRPKPTRDNAARTIGIDYALETGPKVYIERIDILGNVRTEDRVIRREFKLQEGDAFNRLLVTRAKERLQSLGFFKTVDISSQQGSGPDRMVLSVNVEENSTGEVSFGGGYSTSEGIIGDISYKERNLLGKGQFLSLTFSGSLSRAQVDLSFTEPRFLDSNVSAGFDVFHKETNYLTTSGYKLRHSGFDVRLGFPLSDEVGLSTRYTLARDEIFDICAVGSTNCVVPNASIKEGATWTSAVGYTVAYDARNVRNNPTKGVYMELSQDLAGLGGDAHYLRSNAELRAYYPVFDKVTLVGRAIGGNITPWGGKDLTSSDLFFKGGETIRGFATSGYGPRDKSNALALGGEFYYGATAEVRFPLPFVPEDLGLGGAFFADAGSLWRTNDATATAVGTNLVDNNTLRSSVGASLTWNSPLGPLRADYAYVLSKDVNDETQAFKFGAATRF